LIERAFASLYPAEDENSKILEQRVPLSNISGTYISWQYTADSEAGAAWVLLRAAGQVSLVVEALLAFYLTKGIIDSFYRYRK
jgi:hypothetical protein